MLRLTIFSQIYLFWANYICSFLSNQKYSVQFSSRAVLLKASTTCCTILRGCSEQILPVTRQNSRMHSYKMILCFDQFGILLKYTSRQCLAVVNANLKSSAFNTKAYVFITYFGFEDQSFKKGGQISQYFMAMSRHAQALRVSFSADKGPVDSRYLSQQQVAKKRVFSLSLYFLQMALQNWTTLTLFYLFLKLFLVFCIKSQSSWVLIEQMSISSSQGRISLGTLRVFWKKEGSGYRLAVLGSMKLQEELSYCFVISLPNLLLPFWLECWGWAGLFYFSNSLADLLLSLSCLLS